MKIFDRKRQCVNAFATWGLIVAALLIGAKSMANEPFLPLDDPFHHLSKTEWHVADYAFSHPSFDTDWTPNNIRLSGGLHLSLTPKSGAKNRFDGASIRRSTRSQFGRYDVRIRPARGAGVITGFFTYTGPHYGTRHDEIDIEFLGKDTTKMQAAWFVDGVLQSRMIDLGFDAADQARRYSFEWWPDRLRWYVEDKLVLEIDRDTAPLPTEPSYLFANIWAADPSIAAWAGLAAPDTKASAYIGAVAFTPLEELIAALPQQ